MKLSIYGRRTFRVFQHYFKPKQENIQLYKEIHITALLNMNY